MHSTWTNSKILPEYLMSKEGQKKSVEHDDYCRKFYKKYLGYQGPKQLLKIVYTGDNATDKLLHQSA